MAIALLHGLLPLIRLAKWQLFSQWGGDDGRSVESRLVYLFIHGTSRMNGRYFKNLTLIDRLSLGF